MNLVAVDFETEGVEKRPKYPPIPVGVALYYGAKQKEYLAWGHPIENNCTKAQAIRKVKEAFSSCEVVFHNSEFDIAVAKTHMGVEPPEQYHDTMFLAFLNDPREQAMDLKSLADKYLGMPPKERDQLQEWILENVFKARKMKPTKADPLGAHIHEAPGKLVGRYAIGDVERTYKLFQYLYPIVRDRGMLPAYNRELRCMPIFSQMSEYGLLVDHKRLDKDLQSWRKQQAERAEWVRKRLKQPKGWNEIDSKGNLVSSSIDSNAKLADALDKSGKVSHWIMTAPSDSHPEGQRSTSRENLIEVCTDKKLIEELGRFGILQTYIGTFAVPWLESALSNGGRIYPSFNQVRGQEDGQMRGTRTGRPSSNNPNLLNVPRNQEDPLLPNMRNYIIPDPGHVFIIRDYNQQELRILAHFEDGVLCIYFLEDPRLQGEKDKKKWADAHTMVQELIHQIVGVLYPRKDVKVVNFGVIYGQGVELTAKKIGGTTESARSLKKAHSTALPGVAELSKIIKQTSASGEPIVTWGGREYYVEPSKTVRNKRTHAMEHRDFAYKLLNYLIQGSAADCTKEAMIRTSEVFHQSSRLVLQVYDELVGQCLKERLKREMYVMKNSMESIEFDVPMLSDGKVAYKSWGEAEEYND